MTADPDDLDKLLSDVRKSIDENRLFLKTLVDDAADGNCVTDEEEDKDKESEEFEEL